MATEKGRRFVKYLKSRFKSHKPGPGHEAAGLFSTLPPELFEIVTWYLKTADNSSFRLTCRYIEACTFRYWTKFCLESIQTDLSERSYRSLKKLLKEPRLVPMVKKFTVKETNFSGLGKGFKWKRTQFDRRLVVPQPTIQEWLNIVRALPNARSFAICRPVTAFDANEYKLITASDAVTVILAIIIGLRRPLDSFTLDFTPQHRNPIDLTRLNRQDFLDPGFLMAWNKLESLSVRVKLDNPAVGDYVFWMFHEMPNLRRLSFNFEDGKEGSWFMHHVAANSMECKFPLEELRLEKIHFESADVIAGVLRNNKRTLKKLEIVSCSLPHGWWVELLRWIGDNCPALESITLHCLKERGEKKGYVHFPAVSETTVADAGGVRFVYHSRRWPVVDRRAPMRNFYISYQGPKMGTAITKLIEWAEYIRTP
ncbi:uncharacterized protein BJX67DRAFT_382338 [Aspergillus lucknowensis]|uniref:F-box domain-containing protein n=1 Tax=Aspergillus lucknowensis TaxID=176173 RepID=A0ABR4LN38_9EURO